MLSLFLKSSSPIALSIIIPAFNEARRITATLETITAFFAPVAERCEIIVIDDGSIDQTRAIAEALLEAFPHGRCVRHSKNHGKGAAVKTGIEQAQGEYVFFIDADLPMSLDQGDRFVSFFDRGYDIIIGSRNVCDAVCRRAFHRWVLNRLMNGVTRLTLTPGICDTQCGVKVFRIEAARDCIRFQTIMGLAFDVELLHIAQKRGYQIKEAGIAWEDKPWGSVRFFIDPLKVLKDLVTIQLREWRGFYPKKNSF